MFERGTGYPVAVASYDDDGVDAAIDWCLRHFEDDDILTVWTSLKSNLRNCAQLEQLVTRHSNVEHVTGRGGAFLRGAGPVLMAWPDMADIGELVRNGGGRIRALCVISWNEEAIRPWVSAVGPELLGDVSAWDAVIPDLDPVVVEALKSLTSTINHNNTIAAGYEKDMVVSALLALHDAGFRMNGSAMQGWALAHGWSGKNPERLAMYVDDIKEGRRPRSRSTLRADYVDGLRRKAASAG